MILIKFRFGSAEKQSFGKKDLESDLLNLSDIPSTFDRNPLTFKNGTFNLSGILKQTNIELEKEDEI